MNLIEGRKPNFHVSSKIALVTGEKADFENILLDKLPDVLDIVQKKNIVKNNLQTLRKQGVIQPVGKKWILSKRE